MDSINLMRKVEHWRECGQILDIVDRAEKATGYSANDMMEYDDLIEILSTQIAEYLEGQGIDIHWQYQQSVGVGAIVQGPFLASAYGTGQPGDAKAAGDAFADAVEFCEQDFYNNCVCHCQRELEYLSETD